MVEHYTTAEQGKELYELGLDPNTADMYYTIFDGNVIAHLILRPLTEDNWKQLCPKVYTPCWSVGALIDAAKSLKVEDIQITPDFMHKAVVIPTLVDKESGHTYTSSDAYFEGESLIESLVKLVIWLLKDNH